METPRRSPCPVACVLDILGDRWTLLVLRDLHMGKKQFKEFLSSPEKIATNILSARLSRLCQEGLVDRQGSAYAMTEKGKSLLPVLAAVRDWGLKHVAGTADMMSSKKLS